MAQQPQTDPSRWRVIAFVVLYPVIAIGRVIGYCYCRASHAYEDLDPREWMPDCWPAVTVVWICAAAFVGVMTYLQIVLRVPLTTDSVWFQHAGWLITEGYVPYLDLWDPKPVANFSTTTILALLAGENHTMTHFLAVSASVGAAATITATLYLLGRRQGSAITATVAPAAFLLFYRPVTRPAHGYTPKLFLGLAAVLGVYWLSRKHWRLAGGAMALAAGYWQGAGLLVLIAAAVAYESESLKRYLTGVGVMGLLLVGPLALLSPLAVVAMVTELVYPIVAVSESGGLLDRIVAVPYHLGYAMLPALVGAVALARRWPAWRWLTVAVAAQSALVIGFDMDGAADLMLPFVLACAALAVVAADIDPDRAQWATLAIVIVAVALAVPTALGGGPVRGQYDLMVVAGDDLDTSSQLEDGWDNQETRALLVSDYRPDVCHVRLSKMEQKYIQQTPADIDATRCGIWWLSSW